MLVKISPMGEGVVEEDRCVTREHVTAFRGVLGQVGVDARQRLQNSTEKPLGDTGTRCQALRADPPFEFLKARGYCRLPRIFVS